MDMDARLKVAARIAKEAGALLLDFYRSVETYEHKGRVDLVSEADKASEEFLVQEIRRIFPEDGIIAEESEKQDGGISGFVWVVDPLDGTTNFVHSHPHFCVSIGILRDKEPVIGVVYAPVSDDLFSGVRGKGAHCNDAAISVSNTASIQSALIASGFPYAREETVLAPILGRVQSVPLNAHGFRRSGSAALDLCYVAAGQLDAYWEEDVRAWDMAAGLVIVEEAGGCCSGLDGRKCDIFHGRIVASNSKIHGALLNLLFD